MFCTNLLLCVTQVSMKIRITIESGLVNIFEMSLVTFFCPLSRENAKQFLFVAKRKKNYFSYVTYHLIVSLFW